MSVTPTTQAVLLLTAHFTKSGGGSAKPLTPKEWARFALWLKEKSLTPERLLSGRLDELLEEWRDKTVTLDRVEVLLNRGSALALALEKWLRAGLWVMTRSDPDYPKRLKQRLREDSPALLFGCGDRGLLNRGGLAVIGSREAGDSDLAYSRAIGARAAGNGLTIISGGARGVDQAAMLGALEAEGTVIGVMADSLLKACTSAKYRPHLMAKNLVLISPFHPEAGFNAGNAMQRNKYIYCLADAALVVHSGHQGGTWTGAMENLRNGWVPLWVKRLDDPKAGNIALVKKGGVWVSTEVSEIDMTGLVRRDTIYPDSSGDLFAGGTIGVRERDHVSATEKGSGLRSATRGEEISELTDSENAAHVAPTSMTLQGGDDLSNLDFYALFLMKVRLLCDDTPRTMNELLRETGLTKTQLGEWLKRAVAEKKLKKLPKPVRYQWARVQQKSLPLE